MNKKKSHRRPFVYYAALLAALGLVILQWLRLREAVLYWNLLDQTGIQPPVIYIALTGAFWELAFLFAGVGLFFLQPWAIRFARLATAGYLLWYWADRIFVARAELRFTNLIFSIGLTILLAVLAFVILGELKKQVRAIQ